MSGKLFIAGAGSGKTRKIIHDSIDTDKRILILTYTIANEQQIINRFRDRLGIIPSNIKISTWFSFLINEGIRPYQGSRFKERIEGIIFVNGQHITYENKKSNAYFSKENKVYTDKLAECAIELDNNSQGKVIERISKMYDCIYIDEIQDMVGYDLEILKKLIATKTEIIMVGDPRQCTYSTHSTRKHKKYCFGKIDEFLKNECKTLDVEIDECTLNCTYRNNDLICNFANKLYPNITPVTSINKAHDELDGVKIIEAEDVDEYLEKSKAIQLRDNKNTKINTKFPCYNFGESKGLEFKRVIIYPTKPMWDWIINNSKELKDQSRAKLYVALTRAFDSVVIVRKDKRKCDLPMIKL